MLDLGMMNWLRRDARIEYHTITAAITYQQVVGYDPLRFCAILPANDTNDSAFALTDGSNLNRTVYIASKLQTVFLKEEDLGQAVCLPIWGLQVAAGLPIYVMTMSYSPQMRQLYDKLVRKQLSDAGAL